MSLTVSIDGTEYPVLAAQLDATGERFGLYPSPQNVRLEEEALCFVRNPLQVSREDYRSADFKVALFTHKDWPESQVFSLKEGTKSIGLIFSLQTLVSDTGTLRTKSMWNDYGLLALEKLCAGDSCAPGFQQCVRGENYGISELYSDDTVVAIIRASDCGLDKGTQDDFLQYLYDRIPSFVRMGLYLQVQEGSRRVRAYRRNELFKQLSHDNSNLRVRQFAPEFPVSSKQFLTNVLLQTDPYETHPAFRFFLYYQVIESLLQELFEEYYREFVRLAGDPRFNRATAMKDLVAKLHEALSEKARLNLLVHSNGSMSKDFIVLRDHCRHVLDILLPPIPVMSGTGGSPGQVTPQSAPVLSQAPVTVTPPVEDPAALLYSVRNVLFHSFSRVSSREDLEEMVDQFSITICELAMNYTKPTVTLSV